MHDEEHFVHTTNGTPYSGFVASKTKYWTGYPDGCEYANPCYCFYTYTTSGTRKLQGRCASQHTTPDTFGWRQPLPYWAYRWQERGETPKPSAASYPPRRFYVGGSYLYGGNPPYNVFKASPSDLAYNRPYFASLESEAITAAMAEVGEATAEIGVELLEVRKTASYLADKLQFLAENVSDIVHRRVPRVVTKARKKARFGKKTSTISWARKNLPERWMEYRYALMPSVLGVYDLLDLLDKQTRDRPLIVTARKAAVDDTSFTSQDNTTLGSGYSGWQIVRHRTATRKQGVYVVLATRVKRSSLASLNDSGLANPASLMWETLPFSWMVDWAVDVGDFMNAAFMKLHTDLYGGTATSYWVDEDKFQITYDEGYYASRNWQVCYPPVWEPVTVGGSAFNRRVLESSDLNASLHWARHPFKIERAIDALSLLSGALRGKEIRGLRL